ncbi:MAG: tol-pal system protein YbgF [Pseudomonadota bacterium]|nr:tol-pal system protein YbgF [Pseudomonadota bacterium]
MINRAVSSVVYFIILIAFAFNQATAQSTRERLTLLEQQMTQVERVIANSNDSQTDVVRQLQQLQEENQLLLNQIETLQFEVDQAANRQRQLYIDLDERLQLLLTNVAGLSLNTDASLADADELLTEQEGQVPLLLPVIASAEDDYQAAYDLIKQRNYPKAETAFTSFLETHIDSDLRGNAQYWLAEISLVQQDFTSALTGFQTVIDLYPTSRKVPDAWLKIGYCHDELNQRDEALRSLNFLVSQFPETTAALLAKDRIKAIN